MIQIGVEDGQKACYHPSMTRRSKDAADKPVGLTVLNDPEGLAPQVAATLRSAARRIGDHPHRRRGLTRPRGIWPSVTVSTRPGVTDGAGRPGRTETTISHGILARPVLRVSTHTVNATRLMWWDPAEYLHALARLAEGGDGTPSKRDIRRIKVASAVCDQHPAHARDLVVLHTATAFEPVFLYDEGPRHTTLLESRILRAGEGLSQMVEALPRVTLVTIHRGDGGIPGIIVLPFADKAIWPLTEADLELVGQGHPATDPMAGTV